MSGQRTLSLELREFDPSDYERLLEIYNNNYPDYALSVLEQRSRDESLDKSKYLLRRFACLDRATGTILGFGQLSHALDMFHPHKFMVNIYVDPAYQGLGVGGAIYNRLAEQMMDISAEVAWTINKEDLPKQKEFFQHRGFKERRRDWESRIDLSNFNSKKFDDYPMRMAKEGIHFTTLADELRHGEDSLRKLHELVQFITEDMPRQASFTPLSFEQWRALLSNSPRIIPEGYMIATKGPQFVGMSNVLKNEKEPRMLTQDDTGVRREYRGRGIATALKIKVLEFAKKHGYESVKTWNDSTNASMLAVNMKLGFKKQVGWILLEKTFD